MSHLILRTALQDLSYSAPFDRTRNGGSERLSNLPKITPPGGREARIEMTWMTRRWSQNMGQRGW